MINQSIRRTGILALSLSLLDTSLAIAQVVPDRTVDSTAISQEDTIQIDGGTTKGRNLFHSFQDFSVSTGKTALFNNQTNIANIISRVTGDSASIIDGTLKTNGEANLFFLNPNGIVFGKNARLDINGSFLGTTAESIQFADGSQFSATTPKSSNLLTISVPVGLELSQNSGEIRLTNSGHQISSALFTPTSRDSNPIGLEVRPGKTLALIGSEVSLNGGVVSAPSGRLEVGSVQQGQIAFNIDRPQWTFDYNPVTTFGDITLSNRSLLDASGQGGSSLGIFGRRILFQDHSLALILNQGVIPDKELRVEASESITVRGVSLIDKIPTGIYSATLNFGSGAPLTLIAPSITIKDGGLIDALTFSPAQGGDITIKASDLLQVDGTSPVRPQSTTSINTISFGPGATGDVDINTSKLVLSNAGRISSLTFGEGTGGNLSIKAESIELFGFEPLFQQGSVLQAGTLGSGNAGNLTIDTSTLVITDSGAVSVTTLNAGNGGNLAINARDSIEINGNGPDIMRETIITAEAFQVAPLIQPFFDIPSVPVGNAGSITIKTPRLSLRNGAQVSVRAEGTGDAGDLKIFADTITLEDKSSITATTLGGDGGNISFDADFILLKDSVITASASQQGTGGNIIAQTDLFVALGSSTLSAEAEQNLGGNIFITSKAAFFGPEVDLSVSSDAGLQLDGNISIEVEETDIGDTADLETEIETPPQLVSACNPTQGRSSFVVLGPGNLKAKAHHLATTDVPWNASRRQLASSSENIQTASEKPIIQEAIGWEKIDGKLVLVAEHQDQTPKIASQPASCDKT